jgi:hypothetical protein
MRKWILSFSCIIAVVLVLAGARNFIPRAIAQSPSPAAKDLVPVFEKEPAWPKPLPNNWYIGQVTGVSVDGSDHVWIIHRPGGERQQDPVKEAAREAAEKNNPLVSAPRVVEFDSDGNYMRAWGGPSEAYAWPQEEHGITVDKSGRVWISGHTDSFTPGGPDMMDTQILRFTVDGKFIDMIGHPHSWGGSNDKHNFGNPTTMRLDYQANEVFVSDGEGNHRVVVLDATTGGYKRHWGAYGGVPDDTLGEAKYDPAAPPSKQFGHRSVHDLILGNDELVYVTDRANDRIQVFHKDGTFVKEVFIAKETTNIGSTWSLGFSPDQKFLYVGDQTNHKIWILSRETLEILGSFPSPAGHDMAEDSKGNIYEGYPLVKFVFKGYGPANSGQ